MRWWPCLLWVACASPEPERPVVAPKWSVPEGPLPDTVSLSSVDLSLTLDPRADRFDGSIDLHVTVNRAETGIWLHGQDLTITQVSITPQDSGVLPATWTTHGSTGVSRIETNTNLPLGPATVHIEWSAPFATDLSGLFVFEERGNRYVLAKSESIQARRALPSFDEPRFKAPYRIQLTVPAGYVVIGNRAERARETVADGMERVTLAETAALPTYLLSLAVGPFERREGASLGATTARAAVPITGYARPGRTVDLGVLLHTTAPLIQTLEAETGLPFPDPKLDLVAAPAWPSGATELAAAITYREEKVLLGPLDDASIDPAARREMLRTHAHELAHMWFGNAVTPAWWEDLWLKEAFASWASRRALTTWEPNGGHDLEAEKRVLAAMASDGLASVRAIRAPILGDNDIRNAYDSITYGKGMAVIDMVDHGYGPDVFRAALRDHLRTHDGQTTDTPTFLADLTRASGNPNIAETFSSFLSQTGVPVLRVAVDCPNNGDATATLRQDRYRPRGSTIDPHATWTLPVCLEVDTSETPICTILSSASGEMNLGSVCPTWIRPNPGGHGYYRFALSPAHWRALALHLPELPAVEALRIVDSAAAGVDAGWVGIADAWTVFRAAAQHPVAAVAEAPLAPLAQWRSRMPAEDRTVFDPIVQAAFPPKGSDATALLAFSATILGDATARKHLLHALERRIHGDTRALPADLLDAALRVFAEDNGIAGLRALRQTVVAQDVPQLEQAVEGAWGWVTDPAERSLVLDETLSGTLDPRAAVARLHNLLSHPDDRVRVATTETVRSRFDAVISVTPNQWRRDTPALLGNGACSDAEARVLTDFFAGPAGALAPGHARSLARTLESISLCKARSELGTQIARALSTIP